MAAKDTEDQTKDDADDGDISLDMSQAAVKKMIAEARERGYITYDQLNAARTNLAVKEVPADAAGAEKLALDRMKLELIYHDKFNTALAVLSLALIGVPLGIKVSRRETSANFAVAIALTLTYYVMTLSVKVLDSHPEFRPDLLLWLPNIILLTLGTYLLVRVDRR